MRVLEEDKDKEFSALNIGIRADGNNKIGLGHIMRTMSLANKFSSRGHRVFYCIKKNKEIYDILTSNGYEVIGFEESFNLNEETSALNSFLVDYKIDILIGDTKDINQEYLDKINRDERIIVLIDVLRDMSLGADLIINGGIYAEDYRTVAKDYNRNVLLGPRYNLLRNQFTNSPEKNINKKATDILITMGGSDVQDLTMPIINCLQDLDERITYHVVIGNSFKNKIEIEQTAKQNKNILLHHNVKDMANLMFMSDIAISAAGTTLYELAATGTPTIAIIQAENQKLQAYEFDEKGVIVLFKENINIEKEKFKKMVFSLICDKQKRMDMSRLGQEKVDGKGAERCYKEILKLYFKKFNTTI